MHKKICLKKKNVLKNSFETMKIEIHLMTISSCAFFRCTQSIDIIIKQVSLVRTYFFTSKDCDQLVSTTYKWVVILWPALSRHYKAEHKIIFHKLNMLRDALGHIKTISRTLLIS